MPNVLRTVGIEMPEGFPSQLVWRAHERVTAAAKDAHPTAWGEFAGGWNGLAHRLRACSDYSEAFARSLREHGPAPEHEERHLQERALLGFFVSGLSALESHGYGLNALGWMLRPSDAGFRMESDDDRKRVTLACTRQLFRTHFREAAITARLGEVLDSEEFDSWSQVRNVLAHRSAPARMFAPGEERPSGVWSDTPLEPKLTEDRLGWLTNVVAVLLTAAGEFVEHNF
jgi:hypothetical protein